MEMAGQCVILDNGEIIEDGNPLEVAENLQKKHHPFEQSLPQILRLEDKFKIKPSFKIEEVREQIRKKDYRLRKKQKCAESTVLSIDHLYAEYEKGKRHTVKFIG